MRKFLIAMLETLLAFALLQAVASSETRPQGYTAIVTVKALPSSISHTSLFSLTRGATDNSAGDIFLLQLDSRTLLADFLSSHQNEQVTLLLHGSNYVFNDAWK